MADLAALVKQCEAAAEAVKVAKGGTGKAAVGAAVDALMNIKQQITAIDPAHPLAVVDKKAAKKKAAAEKKAAAAAAGGAKPAEGDAKGPSKNAQKAAAKKALKDAKKKAHKENAPPPPPAKAAKGGATSAPVQGDLAAALTAVASQTAGALASKSAHWRSLAPQACGATPLEKAKVAEWMAWAEDPPSDAAAVLDAALTDRSFLAAERLTLADVACYVACSGRGLTGRAAARWLRQAQAECRRLAPKAAWPELAPPGPQNVVGPLAHSAVRAPGAPKATGGPKASMPPKVEAAAPAEAKKQEKKEKKKKPLKNQPAPVVEAASPEEACEQAAPLLDIRVGTVTKCWAHPEAEKLYCEEIDIGEKEGPRTIASGLRPYYASADMIQGRQVLVFANLKARNMQGFRSNGMVLCASAPDHSKVELLAVPAGAKNGDRVRFGDLKVVDAAKPAQVQKKKLLEKVIGFMKTDGKGVATILGKHAFTLDAGVISAPNFPDSVLG